MSVVSPAVVGLSLFVASSAAVTWYTTHRLPRKLFVSPPRLFTSGQVKAEPDKRLSQGKTNIESNRDLPSYDAILERLFNFSTPRNRPRTKEELSSEFKCRHSFFNEHLRKLLLTNSSSTPFSQPAIIHVTGTKGKGSTCELIASALRGTGNRVGVFSSPHLHTACERIKINKTLISRQEFSKLGLWAMNCLAHETWAVFFDALLLMALRYFVENRTNYIVLEVGIGGRYDSTNFFDTPQACVITSVSLDHQAMLGNTIADIAWQKAGIIKAGSPVFVPANLHPDALLKVREECTLKNAPLHVVKLDSYEKTPSYNDIEKKYSIERENIIVSAAVCKCLGIDPEGMKGYYWPCRMETFDLARICGSNQNEPVVVLDGSHNALSVDLCVREVRERYPVVLGYDIWVAFGSGKDKNLPSMLEAVFKTADKVITIVSKHFRAQDAKGMVESILPECTSNLLNPSESMIKSLPPIEGNALQNGNVAARMNWAINEARKRSRSNAGKKVVIVVCGSLFVAAEAREFLFRSFPSLFSPGDWVHYKDDEIPMSEVPTPGSGRQSVRKSLYKGHNLK